MGTTEMCFESVEVSYIYSFHLEWNENFFVKRRPVGEKVEELYKKANNWLTMPIVYLFDEDRILQFREEDIKDPKEFLNKLKNPQDDLKGLYTWLKKQIAEGNSDFQSELHKYSAGDKPSQGLLDSLIDGITSLLEKGTFVNGVIDAIKKIDPDVKKRVKKCLGIDDRGTKVKISEPKRLWCLFEEIFSNDIVKRKIPVLVKSKEKLEDKFTPFKNCLTGTVGSKREHFRPMLRYFFLGKDSHAKYDRLTFWPDNELAIGMNDNGNEINLHCWDNKGDFTIKGALYRRLCLGADGTGTYTATLKFNRPNYSKISTQLDTEPTELINSFSDKISYDSNKKRLMISMNAETRKNEFIEKAPDNKTKQAIEDIFDKCLLGTNLLYALINLPTRFKVNDIPRTGHNIEITNETNQAEGNISSLFHSDLQSFVKHINEFLWEYCGVANKTVEKSILESLGVKSTDEAFVRIRDFDVVPRDSLFCQEGSGSREKSLKEYNFYQLPSVYVVVKTLKINEDDIPKWIAPDNDTKNWKIFANMLLNLRGEIEKDLDLHYLRRYVYDSVQPKISQGYEDEDAIPNILPNKNIYTMASMRTFISVCKNLKDEKKNEIMRSVIEEVARTIELVRERWHFSTINNLLLDRVIAEIQHGKGNLYLPQVDPALFRKIIERRRRCVAFLSSPCGKGHFSRIDPIWKFGHYLWNEMQIDELNEALLKKLHLTETMYTDMFQFQNLSRLEGLDVPQESVREKTSRFLELLLKFREANKDKDREAILEEMAKIEVDELKDVLKGS
ncbi:MAG: hypothetical protein KAV87_44710 [Desulfobacteraceae bacterium]|nr:hypothetical protein [Desulfobacteraceae bacterium]